MYSVLMTTTLRLASATVPRTPIIIEVTQDATVDPTVEWAEQIYMVKTIAPIGGWNGIRNSAMVFDNEKEARDYANEEWTVVIAARNAAEKAPEITEGFWHIGHRVFRVKMAKSGYLYAQELIGTTWTYSPGSMARLKTSGEPLDSETAATYGKTFGICALCGRTLTDPDRKSVV